MAHLILLMIYCCGIREADIFLYFHIKVDRTFGLIRNPLAK